MLGGKWQTYPDAIRDDDEVLSQLLAVCQIYVSVQIEIYDLGEEVNCCNSSHVRSGLRRHPLQLIVQIDSMKVQPGSTESGHHVRRIRTVQDFKRMTICQVKLLVLWLEIALDCIVKEACLTSSTVVGMARGKLNS